MGNEDEIFQTACNAMYRTLRTTKLDVGLLVQLLDAKYRQYLIPPMAGLYGPIGHYPLLLPDTLYVARGYLKDHGNVTLLVTYEEALRLTGVDIYALESQTRWGEYYRTHRRAGSSHLFLTAIQHVNTEKLIIPKDWMLGGSRRQVGTDCRDMPNRMTQLVTSFVAHAVRDELTVPFRSPWVEVFKKNGDSDHSTAALEQMVRDDFLIHWKNIYGTDFKRDIEKIVGPFFTHLHTVSAVQHYIHVSMGIDYHASLKLEEWMQEKERENEAGNILGR